MFLNVEGKKRFFVGYERRMPREYVSEQTGGRTTLRDELFRQAVGMKHRVVSGEPPRPFLMN